MVEITFDMNNDRVEIETSKMHSVYEVKDPTKVMAVVRALLDILENEAPSGFPSVEITKIDEDSRTHVWSN